MTPKFINGTGYYNLLSQEEIENVYHVVNFSGGRTSAYLLYKLAEQIPNEKLVVCFANTGKEDEATLEFVRDCEKDLGLKFNWLEYDLDFNNIDPKNNKPKVLYKKVSFETASRDGKPLALAFEREKFLPNLHQRNCTIMTKIETCIRFIKAEIAPMDKVVEYIGIRWDEPKRWSKNVNQFDNYTRQICYPLVDWKVTKQMVLDFWKNQSFDLKLVEPFGNCDLCYLKSTKKRIAILQQRPEAAKWWSEQEEKFDRTFDLQYSVKQLYKIATGKALLDESKCQINDIDCNCNVD